MNERKSMFPDACIAIVTLEFANGKSVSRGYWTSEPWPAWMEEKQEFLGDLAKDWPRPQEPIRFTATVAEGHEQEARDLLGYE